MERTIDLAPRRRASRVPGPLRRAALALTVSAACAPAPGPEPGPAPLHEVAPRPCGGLLDCDFDALDRANPLDADPAPTAEERRVVERWLGATLGFEGETPSIAGARCGPVRLRSHVAADRARGCRLELVRAPAAPTSLSQQLELLPRAFGVPAGEVRAWRGCDGSGELPYFVLSRGPAKRLGEDRVALLVVVASDAARRREVDRDCPPPR